MKRIFSNKLISGGAILSAGVAVVAAFTFARSLILARGISVEDFGIATALLTSLSLVQMATAIAAEKQILQDKDGASRDFLAAVHNLAILRGFICGLIMFALALPISAFFGLPDILWAFQMVALAPVISGFVHYDYSVKQRNSDHKSAVIASTLPDILVTLVLIPAVFLLSDFRAILFICLGWPVTKVLVSHLVAGQTYQIGSNPELLVRLLKFSWPLMLSGLLLFLIFQGDRAIVGHYFDMKSLGHFSLVLTAFFLPSQLLHRVYDSLLLSTLSKAYQRRENFEQIQSLIWSSLVVLSAAYIWFCLMFGPWLFISLFGEKYTPGVSLLPWIVLLVSIRTLRIAPSLFALATARPISELYANLARTIALPLAIGSLYLGYSLESVVIAGILGESCALLVGFTSLGFLSAKFRFSAAELGAFIPWLISVACLVGLQIINVEIPFQTALFAAGLLLIMGILFIQKISNLKAETGLIPNV